jgi:hypothetical protein
MILQLIGLQTNKKGFFMEHTCNQDKCKLFDLLGGTVEQCPNYVEGWWQPDGENVPILIKDCAPKRSLLLMQNVYNQMINVQQSNEQQRNEATNVTQALAAILIKAQQINFKAQQIKEIEN